MRRLKEIIIIKGIIKIGWLINYLYLAARLFVIPESRVGFSNTLNTDIEIWNGRMNYYKITVKCGANVLVNKFMGIRIWIKLRKNLFSLRSTHFISKHSHNTFLPRSF